MATKAMTKTMMMPRLLLLLMVAATNNIRKVMGLIRKMEFLFVHL